MAENLDVALFYAVNKGWNIPFLDFVMLIASELGSGRFLFAVALFLFLSGKREKSRLAVLLLAALSIAYYSVDIAKNLVARPRPFDVLPGVILRMGANGFSLPSGHTAHAFIAAFLLSSYFKKCRFFYYGLAVLVGISRVYVGVHYPLDAAAGAVMGVVFGYVFLRLVRSLGFSLEE